MAPVMTGALRSARGRCTRALRGLRLRRLGPVRRRPIGPPENERRLVVGVDACVLDRAERQEFGVAAARRDDAVDVCREDMAVNRSQLEVRRARRAPDVGVRADVDVRFHGHRGWRIAVLDLILLLARAPGTRQDPAVDGDQRSRYRGGVVDAVVGARMGARDQGLSEFDQGLSEFKKEGDFMKCHFIEQFTKPDEKISIYRTGKFVDFCRGPHIPSTGKIKAFKLLNIAGAYWLGDEKNPQLQRIYGTSFFSKKDLEDYLKHVEETKKRDHRVLGKQLDLFSIQELAGPGLIFWHPKGGIIRKEMEDWMREEYIKRGYSLVYTPHVARRQLFYTSGHEGYYSQNMFDAMELDDAEYRLKPMNCPGHILVYRDSLKSYRDLPVRLGELGTVYRYERSGVMHGLLRVRGFTQDDAHIFCTPEQIEGEIADCLEFALDVLKDFGFDKFQTELSTWNPDDRKNFVGSEEQWNHATQSLEKVLKARGIDYKTIPGEAAFYGPKIDIKLVDAIGRLWQLSTVQFDFNLPQRFGLEYVAEDGSRKQPVMVHRALYGSVERFFGVLIEHYAGAFPVWLSPVQAVMIPISERHAEYANKVAAQLKAIGVRVEVDARNEKMNAKIREHAMQKVPFLLVVGDKEAEAGKVNVRTRGKEKTEDMLAADFVEKIGKLIAEKSPGL